jgi:hypothetical protein
MANSPLVDFYWGRAADAEGRMIDEILGWNLRQLEAIHDYIQWLFPLQQRSQFNRHAPVLTQADIEIFKTHPDLQDRVKRSLYLMLDFYGFECEDNDESQVLITLSEQFLERSLNWLNLSNHNYLRLTRILTSLRLLGLETYAQTLFKALDQVYQIHSRKIGDRTYRFWREAATHDSPKS